MKKILYSIIGLFSVAVMFSCTDDVDNSYSRFTSIMEMTVSADEIVLNEDTPDDVALTITWTDAMDYGSDFVTTYLYKWQLTQSAVSAKSEYEDLGIFKREYTHSELQSMMIDDFGYLTSTWGTMRFTVTASFEGTRIVLPEECSVDVRVKTYGAKQFAADAVYMGGTAVGNSNVELTASETNSSLYVYNGSLSAGKLNFPVVYGDENNFIIPSEGSDQDITSDAMAATIVGEDDDICYWIIPETQSYRVTLNFSTQTVTIIPTADIMEIDKLYMTGTAVADGEQEFEQTLENESIYAYYGTLSAGTLYFPVEYDGSRSITIVPSRTSASAEILDGQADSFTSVNAVSASGRYWEIPSDGTYRVVMDIDAKTLTIYSEETDFPKRSYSWNNTVDGINPYEAEVEALWMWGSFASAANRNEPSDDYKMTASAASPYIFVYSGDTLGSGTVKFLVSNKWNNVYAFGATDTRDSNITISLDTEYTMVGGQSNNRYSYYVMSGDVNFIVVDITDDSAPTVIFRNK